jgi:hypothetical protein
MVGLIPLILAFGLPVYPLLRLAWLNWLELGLIWVGFALMGIIVAVVCLYIIGRQIYLLWGGSQTVVELSHEIIHPGQTIQAALAYRPGRLLTQSLVAKLICRETVRLREPGRGGRHVTAIHLEETLIACSEADIPSLQFGSQPVTITIPEEALISTDPDHFPLIEWWIEVTIKVAQAPDFRLTFPIKVIERPLSNQGSGS